MIDAVFQAPAVVRGHATLETRPKRGEVCRKLADGKEKVHNIKEKFIKIQTTLPMTTA
jgi:hypothetical protein